jgi:hypothetical protein
VVGWRRSGLRPSPPSRPAISGSAAWLGPGSNDCDDP